MNESGLAGYPGSESVSVPPATVASVRRTWIRFGNSLFRVFLFLPLGFYVILADTRVHMYIYVCVYIYMCVYITYVVTERSLYSEANEHFSKCDCYVKSILFSG